MKSFWVIFLVLTTTAFAAGKTPQLVKGELDLTRWKESNPVMIHGQWLALPDQIIDASNYKTLDFPALFKQEDAVFMESVALFLESSIPDFKGHQAAFVLHVRNPTARSLGIQIEGYKNDFETSIFVPDADFFFKLDEYGNVRSETPLNGAYSTPSRYYNLDAVSMMGRDFYLIVNSRGAQMRGDQNGLGVSHMKLASSSITESNELGKRIEQFLILGMYAMLLIYSLTIYYLRREDKSSLTVALLTLFLALRYTSTERILLMTESLYWVAPYNFILMKVVHTAAAFAVVAFIRQKFRQFFSVRFFHFGLAVVSFGFLDAFAMAIWNMPLSMFANAIFLGGFTFVIVPYFIYIGWKAKHVGGIYSSMSLLFFTIAMLNDFFQAALGRLDPVWMGHFGMLSLAVGFALVNAKIFANTFQKTVELNDSLELKNEEITYFNKNLEKLVTQKTQEITALLDHIPQGVLSLETGGIISRDFSRHLLDIVEEKQIAGRSFKELVLDRSNIGADRRDQAWQTLQVIIGEADINFDANVDKLPSEFAFSTRSGTKWLKATWNVEVNDLVVKKVLVTLLDVSKEKELEKEAEGQRQEFEIIRELVDAGARKIGQYFVSATALLGEIEKILEKSEQAIDHPDIQCMFINMHTIKGGARTLGLKDLARIFHEVEEYYQDILRHGAAIQKDRLTRDIRAAFTVYEHYQNVNRSKLNRSDDYSKVVIDRDFVEGHYQILRDIVVDLDKKEQPLESIIQRIHSQKDTIIRLIFDQLPAVFDEYKSKADKIAKEVHKPKPLLDFSLDAISITPEMKSMLDNCMVHLLRNALCHGIESPDERLKAAKAEAGTITVKSNVQNNMLNLEIFDDGRGLAIEKLRAKGQEGGRLPDSATVQEIAELIFAPGVTTAQEVTHISGRGVGMDAVRKFLEQQGGGIEIRLGNPKDDARRFYNFKFLIHIPLQKPKVYPSLVPRTA